MSFMQSKQEAPIEHKLSEKQVAFLNEIEMAIRDLTSQKIGALNLIVRAEGLRDNWALDLPGGRLVKEIKS